MADPTRYSLVKVANLLMEASELYMQITSPAIGNYTEVMFCPHGGLYFDYSAPAGKRGRACRTCVSDVHASIVGRPNLSQREREDKLDELIDLDAAMVRLDRHARRGVAAFLEDGPRELSERNVTFRERQAHYIVVLCRAMNGDEEKKA